MFDFWSWYNEEALPRLGRRAHTFTYIFRHLDLSTGPVNIVETGCARLANNWEGDGQSTVLFDKFTQYKGGTVFSVDIDPKSTDACRQLVSDRVQLFTEDSVAMLHRNCAMFEKIGTPFFYLDSFDFDEANPYPSAIHHLKELTAIAPILTSNTLVVVDDSPMRGDKVSGKGFLIDEYAQAIGASRVFTGYQTGYCGW